MAIAPVDIIVDLNVSLKDNENGTQSFSAEHVKTKFKFKKCEFVFNPDLEDAPELKKEKTQDSDEDFDD